MTTVGQQLLIAAIPGIPLTCFLVLVLFGRILKENAQFVALLGTTVSLVFSVFAVIKVAGLFGLPEGPIQFSVDWIDLGPGGSFPMGVYIDEWASVMLVIVCFVSLMVQLFSGGYMEGHQRFAWYYAVVSIFTGSMLGLVVSPNFIQAFIFWELVGGTSYLIHGFYFEKPEATYAAQKAFIVNRVADAALFVGIILFWREVGSTAFSDIADAARAGFVDSTTLTVALVMVFLGAAGKSAQFPLHVWLSNAMQGPTPLSALIHAAAMILSGVYLITRTYDIFVQSPTAMMVLAYGGAFTAFMAATMALVQRDIKQVIAYSTISQLGYVMLGLGIGAYTASAFHIWNHAFFKALLFLVAGSLGYRLGGYKLFDMGGLRRRMPVTFWAIVMAGISLAGIFPFSGFFSKDAIVAAAYEEHHYFLFALALITVFLTAFYIFRAIFIAFMGEPRTETARNAVESPGIMVVPMVILAFFSVVSGWVGIPESFGLPIPDLFGDFVVPSGFATETLALEDHGFSFVLALVTEVAAIAGIALAYVLAVSKPGWAKALGRRFAPVGAFLNNGWYIDAIYGAMFVRPAKFLGRLARGFDRNVIGDLVTGVGRGTSGVGGLLNRLQTGRAQNYALFILAGVVVLGVIVGAQYAFMVIAVIALITLAVAAAGARL